MIFVTYHADTGALIGVTDQPPAGDPATCTRAVNMDSVELVGWDANTRQFREEGGSASREITPLQYMGRFTDDELATIYGLAETNMNVRIWVKKFERTNVVDLGDPRTAEGVHQLEAVGIPAAGRAAQILS